MLTYPPLSLDQIQGCRTIKSWYNFTKYYPKPDFNLLSTNYAHTIKINSRNPHLIEYKNIDCSYFIWLTIFHFNRDAALAIRASIPKIEAYLKRTYDIYMKSSYPMAIHFALLARDDSLWHESMYNHFELVDFNNLSEGSIVAWAFDTFLQPKNSRFNLDVDTGHVACVSSSVFNENKIKMCHSVPRKNDPKPKKQGGPTESTFTLDGYILKNIANGRTTGGAFKFKDK